jgi:dihydrofolate reductase
VECVAHQGRRGQELATLKSQAGGHILKYGVSKLDRTLLHNGLVDEYDLWIMPTRVGQGKRAFADVDADKLNLEFIRTHQFGNGVVILKYRPASSVTKPSKTKQGSLLGPIWSTTSVIAP